MGKKRLDPRRIDRLKEKGKKSRRIVSTILGEKVLAEGCVAGRRRGGRANRPQKRNEMKGERERRAGVMNEVEYINRNLGLSLSGSLSSVRPLSSPLYISRSFALLPPPPRSGFQHSWNLLLLLLLSLSLFFSLFRGEAWHIYAPTKPESGGSLDGVSIFAAAPN